MMRTLSLLPFIIVLAVGQATAQVFQSINYQHSIVSGGMGEQGVTLANPADAMQYNPANLARTDDLSLSFYRNPWPQSGWNGSPITTTVAAYRPTHAISIGLEYTDYNWGTIPITTVESPEGTGQTFQIFDRSVAGAVALSLGSEWALGAEFRYAWMEQWSLKKNHLLFGAGAAYTPEALNDRLHAGLSFMSFSTAVKNHGILNYTIDPGSQWVPVSGDISYPVPSRINLGADFAMLHEPHFDLTLSLGFTKGITKYDDTSGAKAQSSFTALFSDWQNFPEDVTTYFGLGWVWKPLPLGRGISYIQEMYLGYASAAVWAGNINYYTHGVRAGFDFSGVRATAGYAGRWHNNKANSFFYFDDLFVTETFQFAVSADLNALQKYDAAADRSDRLSKIIVSGGYSYCAHLGRWDHIEIYGASLEFKMPSLWSVESDFYLSENSALIGSFAYGHLVESAAVPFSPSFTFHISEDVETLSLESGYRYHPIDAFHPFFVQASLGLVRLNPVNDYTGQRHFYYPYDNLVVGCTVPIENTGITVVPKAGFKTIFMDAIPSIEKLSGNNQFEFGVNLGYAL